MSDSDDSYSVDSGSTFSDMDFSDSDLDNFIAYSSDNSNNSFDSSSTRPYSRQSDSDDVRPVISATEDEMEPESEASRPPSDVSTISGHSQDGVLIIAEIPAEPAAAPVAVTEDQQVVPALALNTEQPGLPQESSDSTEPEYKKRKITSSPSLYSNSDEEGLICPICFEPWTNTGDHRLISLRCGHLFGKLCIENWMKSSSKGAKGATARCPQCKASAKKKDIRPVFARNLRALDTSERDRAIKDLAEEQQKRQKLELQKNQSVLRLQMALEESERLKKELCEHKNIIDEYRRLRARSGHNELANGLSQPGSSKSRLVSEFRLEKTVSLSKEGGCRVMAVSNILPLMVVSRPNKTGVFPGFGVTKISTLDLRPADFIYLHSKDIKDIAFHSHDSLILSASLDKTVKLTNVCSNSVVQTYPMDMEVWSCAWNTDGDHPNTFYAGLRNGTVAQLDTRMPPKTVQILNLPVVGSSSSPVVRLQYVPRKYMKDKGFGGVLALQLTNCCFYENKNGGTFQAHPLSLKGNFTSLSLESSTGSALISSRPSPKQLTIKHMLGDLRVSDNMLPNAEENYYFYKFEPVNTVDGGPVQAQITRSQIFLDPNSLHAPLICAGDEASQAALIWDASSGVCKEKLPADFPILDVTNFSSGTNIFLSTLTKESIRFFKHTRCCI